MNKSEVKKRPTKTRKKGLRARGGRAEGLSPQASVTMFGLQPNTPEKGKKKR